MACDPIDMKRPEQTDPQTVGLWVPGAGEGMGVTADGDGASFGGMEMT